MALFVQGQVVGAGKAALAVGTLERFHSRVLAKVSRQLVGPGKLPCAAFPHALVRFLACGNTFTVQGKKKNSLNTVATQTAQAKGVVSPASLNQDTHVTFQTSHRTPPDFRRAIANQNSSTR